MIIPHPLTITDTANGYIVRFDDGSRLRFTMCGGNTPRIFEEDGYEPFGGILLRAYVNSVLDWCRPRLVNQLRLNAAQKAINGFYATFSN